MNTKIKFSRDKYIETSRSIALIRLQSKSFTIGEPVVIRYYVDDEKTTVDSLLAVGIKNGSGIDCFRVVSTGENVLVVDVVTEVPDVSSLAHNELYLFNNLEDNTWNYVYIGEGSERIIEPIGAEPRTFTSLKDNNIWVSDDSRKVRSLNNFYTKEEVNELINKVTPEEIREELEAIRIIAEEAAAKSEEAITKVEDLDERTSIIPDLLSSTSKVSIELVNYESNYFIVPTSFDVGDLNFNISVKDINGETVDINKVTFVYGEESYELEPTEEGYYQNPVVIDDLGVSEDIKADLTFIIETDKFVVSSIYSIFGLVGFRYVGRVGSTSEISSLTPDLVYNWDNLVSRDNICIEEGTEDVPYFVIAYPKVWGNAEKILSNPFVLYKSDSSTFTFEEKEVSVEGVSYLAYIYRNKNLAEFSNISIL